MLSPHPPQIHSPLRSSGLPAEEHPHESSCPSRQPRAMLNTTPAEAMAFANAASFEAAIIEIPAISSKTVHILQTVCTVDNLLDIA